VLTLSAFFIIDAIKTLANTPVPAVTIIATTIQPNVRDEKTRRLSFSFFRLTEPIEETHDSSILIEMFSCSDCGNKTRARFDRCPKCNAWNTAERSKITRERIVRLSDVADPDVPRIAIREDWDRALGGGAKQGSTIIVAGNPGVGKTTEMLSIASLRGSRKFPVLYATSERDVRDLADSARTMRLDGTRIAPVRVRSMRDVRKAIDAIAPMITVIDSATNLDRFEAEDFIELRECIGEGCAFVICHVTKAQEIAGRNGLAHQASAIVWIRGKTLRTSKNWYGPAPMSVRRKLPKFRKR